MLVKTSPDEIQNFLSDASNFTGSCDAVYFPENSSETAEIIKKADKEKTPVTIAGNGTGLTGARVPQGGIVISTERLNKVIEINAEGMFAVVEPGVILADFQELVHGKNLLYPPDPTEKNCFIGGTVATNASGEKTFKYGPTRNYVTGLDILTAKGETLKLKRGVQKAVGHSLSLKTEEGTEYKVTLPDYEMPRTKNASGYFSKENMDAIDLFIGSEGTLGVIAKIKVKLVPLPEKIISCIIFFDDEKDALAFIGEARNISLNTKVRDDQRCIEALALEYFDEHSLKFMSEDYPQVPGEAKAAVWFEQEVNSRNEDTFFECWMDLIKEFHGDEETAWFAVTEEDKKRIIAFRHSVSVKVNELISKYQLRKLGTDVAVPDEKFEELYFNSKKIVEDEGMQYIIYGHAGNSHIHLNMLPKSREEYETGLKLYDKICSEAVRLGGTVSAEHGIGKAKTKHLVEMYGIENVKKMAEVKKVLDPNFILGRGNIFEEDILTQRR
jgi:D-lactate dehydrogenase (cytochrome)